jgi:YesN/AraC family two-component response regulator
MDLYMPVMNGVEAMKNIQNSCDGKKYNIIVVSAHSYESVKNELKDINIINKFVQKPINKKKIEEILNEFYY